MLPLIGLAAIAMGVMAFDFLGSTEASATDNSSSDNDEGGDQEAGYISIDLTPVDDAGPSEVDLEPEIGVEVGSNISPDGILDARDNSQANSEISAAENDVPPLNSSLNGELDEGELDLPSFDSDFEIADSEIVSSGANQNNTGDKGANSEITGTGGDDLLIGVNVHIDVATGIVGLFGTSSESLFGGHGDDILGIGAGDVATGGEGEDEFIVDGQITSIEESAGSVPMISDFQKGEDQIVVSIPTSEQHLEEVYPDRPDGNFDVSFECTEDETLILVDGLLVCKLAGKYDLTIDDVSVQYDYHSSLKTDFEERYGY